MIQDLKDALKELGFALLFLIPAIALNAVIWFGLDWMAAR